MEMFTHINELKSAGYTQLRTLVLACPRVTLWAPSATYMEELRTEGIGDQTMPTPAELLAYVRAGNVRIMARRWWYTDPDRRNLAGRKGWVHKRWVDEFDGAIRGMWEEDQVQGRIGTSARVELVDEEEGWDWARRAIDDRLVKLEPFLRQVERRRDLGPYIENARRAPNEREAAVALLRDAWNHGDAFRRSGADRNLGSPADSALLEVLVEAAATDAKTRDRSGGPRIDGREVVNTIDEVFRAVQNRAGRPPKSAEEAKERLDMLLADAEELARFRRWVEIADRACRSMRPDAADELRGHLLRQLGDSPPRDLKEELKHAPWETMTWFLTEVVFESFVKFAPRSLEHLVPSAFVHLGIEVFLFTAGPGYELLEKTGMVSVGYEGDRWPFYVGWGQTNPRRTWMRRLYRELATERT